MGHSCILTDNAAQFTRPNFTGYKNIVFLDEQIELQENVLLDLCKVRVSEFPSHVNGSNPIHLRPPSATHLSDELLSIYQMYDDIFIILVSKELHPTFSLAEEIVMKLHGKADFHLIDTQSIALGEGQIIQLAAELIAKNISGAIIEECLREAIPHTYTLLCTPNFSYLHKSGFIDLGQAVSGEILSFLPIFTLEGGKLIPVEKVKNIHNVTDYFIEFIDEFDDLKNVSFIQPSPTVHNESKLVKQHIEEFFPDTHYSEHTINPYLASLIGPQGIGIVVTEAINS